MSRGDLSEIEWRVLRDLLPIEPSMRGRGRRPTEKGAVLNGILWRVRCGAPWRDVPERYGKRNTIYWRFRRWSEAGAWEILSVTLAEMMTDTNHYSIDSTTIRAHVSAAGVKGHSSSGSWLLAGRVGCKVHCIADAGGRPLAFI